MKQRTSIEEIILKYILILGIVFPLIMLVFDLLVHKKLITISIELFSLAYFGCIIYLSKKSTPKQQLFTATSIYL